MVFTAVGLLVGSEALGLIDVRRLGRPVKLLAEATLALGPLRGRLADRRARARGELSVPLRLLAIGLPLTLVSGFLVGSRRVPPARVVRGAAPRGDPRADGRGARSGGRDADEAPESSRQGLNVESGLNDGICVPLFWIVLAIAQAESGAIGNGSCGSAGARADRLRHPGRSACG
jgi:hypothetical protein